MTLVHGAWELDPPTSAVRQAFIGWILSHLHPDGHHILQPSKAGETSIMVIYVGAPVGYVRCSEIVVVVIDGRS